MAKPKYDLSKLIPISTLDKIQSEYINELYEDPKYSLEIDPEDVYHMSDEQRDFIYYYIQYRELDSAAAMAGIDNEIATEFLKAQSTRCEIERITMAQRYRQLGTRMLSLDEIGGFLTSLVLDSNVAIVDRLNTSEKVKVSKMLMDLHKLKHETVMNPNIIDYDPNLDSKIEELSVADIEKLLSPKTLKENKKQYPAIKEDLIDRIMAHQKVGESLDFNTLLKLTIPELTNVLENLENNGVKDDE